ncbi:MAG: hypothetical protein M3526_05085 [Actinomycetota bacterium]|nr:hypothetical protein [Actinomycetota bacterium]
MTDVDGHAIGGRDIESTGGSEMNPQQRMHHHPFGRRPDRRTETLAGCALAAVLLVGAVATTAAGRGGSSSSTPIPQPSAAQLKAAELYDLPLAPKSARVDLTAQPFSNPTDVTNPLFPISELHSVLLNGKVDGKPFRTETTLLPDTRFIEWSDGQRVEVLVSQYTAYLDGRLEEVALDFYAQADDGSVWYLGEDVFNYNEQGYVADTGGTWLAGKEGPLAMIMPAAPTDGKAFRPENIPGLVFEEVTVKDSAKTVDGPQGPVTGAMVGTELHDDGSFSDKIFAPGYGEFYSAHEGDVEALALAVPTDALPGPPPRELKVLSAGAHDIFDLAADKRWGAASATAQKMAAAWKSFQASEVPPRLVGPTSRSLEVLIAAVDARLPAKARGAAIHVGFAALDLQLRHRPPAGIDLARFDLWAHRVLVDAAANDLGAVTGDVATLEWIRDRFVHVLAPVEVTRIDQHLLDLRGAASDEDLPAAAAEAADLIVSLARIEP